MKATPKIAFVVNGACRSAMGERARGFTSHLHRYDIRIAYRSGNKLLATLRFTSWLVRVRPSLVYVLDIAYSGVLAAGLYKLFTRTPLLIDTGDAISELAKSMGRSNIGKWLTRRLEAFSYWIADLIVVRGSFHRELLQKSGLGAELIRDGVDVAQFAPSDASELRRQRGLDRVFTIGVLGNSVWSERLQMCYGWDLVEVVRLLRQRPIRAVMIGGGSGLEYLRQKCREYGIEDRVDFPGYIPHDQLPRELAMIDVCISTQTNDVVGNVRTTGKLPLYLASGRHIIASRVGEAALLLDDESLVDYEGQRDASYPAKVAARIERLLSCRFPLQPVRKHMDLAREQFDYSVLAPQLAAIFDRCLTRH